MASSQQHRCVFVGNIPYDATEEQLVQICEEVGPVVNFRLVIDRETGKPKGYGFCEYKDEETALSARRNLQGYEINGRQLRVDFAENDKGNDRNREQGRGGPGIAVNAAQSSHGYQQKHVGGPAVGGDSILHQSAGLPLAMTAASVMAGVLGGGQSGAQSNGLSQLPTLGSDPLTLHLAQMSRSQLTQVLSEVKVLATHNIDLARQLLLGCPHLPKALFQAQIMLGMVTPQMLQTPNIRQAPTPVSQPLVHAGQLSQQSSLPGLPPIVPLSSAPQSSLAPNQFSAPMQRLPPQPRILIPSPSHVGAIHQTTAIPCSGDVSVPPARPQTLGGMQSGRQMQGGSSVRPVQPSLLQNPGQMGPGTSGNSQLSVPKSSYQTSHANGPTLPRPGVQTSTPGYSRKPQTIKETAVVDRVNMNTPVLPASSSRQDGLEHSGRPSKLLKQDDGRAFTSASVNIEPKPQSASRVGLPTTDPVSRADSSADMGREGTHLEIPPDTQAALLQQVLKLTPEQLSALPPEQQQQVFQLQKMLMQSEKR